MTPNAKHTITRDGIRYSRHSDRGLQILKEEYEQGIRHMMALITTTCVMCICGMRLSVQSFT